jgi:hypothetical protein
MSHIRVAKISIKNFNLDIARQALQQLQKIYGGQLIGNKLVWSTYGFIEIQQNGEIKYDDYRMPLKYDAFSKAFSNMYTALLLKLVGKQFGYDFKIMPKQTEKGLQVLMGGAKL